LQMPDPELQIEGDQVRLVQIVRNLLSNAVKFTPPGGSIELSIAAADSSVQIEVRDTGCVVTPALLPRLFDPFAEGSPEAGPTGVGLGLTITNHLVALHTGPITAHGAGPGQVPEFRVSLPLPG